MFSKIQAYIAHHQLIAPTNKLVVGLSGGPDSVFLLHFLAQIQKDYSLTLIAAHLDHQWRPNSHDDVLFCKKLAEQLEIPFVTSTIKELGKEFTYNGSKEAQGRTARRYFLEKVAQENKADNIALAHHLQDQEETFFIRLIRGCSLTGLTGMLPKEGKYIRPLLETNKADILAYLNTNNIAYLIDPTNEHMTYLRNRIRATVLPALQECDERFNENFLETVKRLQDTEDYLELETQRIYKRITTDNGLHIKEFIQLHPILQYRIIIFWLIQHKVPFTPSQTLIDEILRFLQQPAGGSHKMHSSWQINKKKNLAAIELL